MLGRREAVPFIPHRSWLYPEQYRPGSEGPALPRCFLRSQENRIRAYRDAVYLKRLCWSPRVSHWDFPRSLEMGHARLSTGQP